MAAAPTAAAALRALERVRAEFGGGGAARKLALLSRLERARLETAAQVSRLHECLCFLRAYPDDPTVLARVERMLARFARRPDLRRHAEALASSGIAGTAIRFRFFEDTARWIAERWPERLAVDWPRFENSGRLKEWLPLLVHPGESPAIEEVDLDGRDWIERMKGPGETDGACLVRRFAALPMNSFAREILYDGLDPALVLAPGPGTPTRTLARHRRSPVAFQARPLDRRRPDLAAALRRPEMKVRDCGPREARALIDLARAAMVTRERDLDAFEYADPHDVRMVDAGDGLEFAVFGVVPERRLLLESVYAFLTLRSGVPIGYVLISALYRSSETAYNIFETWRGAEAGRIYGRVLAVTRALFGSDAFTIFPYQLGQGNDEGLRSGAWWFYRKLGFAPRDAAAVRRMRAEERHMRANPAHRSSLATLAKLAESNLYFHLGRPRRDVIGLVDVGQVGLRVMRHLARRFGGTGDRGARACEREASRWLGLRSLRGWSAGERFALRRWSPLILVLAGRERWSARERRALIAVVRAKGGPREADFARRFDAHHRLREGVLRLAATTARG